MTDEIMVLQIASGGGDGCCGGVVNDEFLRLPEADDLTCANGASTAWIYRRLRQAYSDGLEINMVDPKNTIAIVAYLTRWWWQREISARHFAHGLALGIRPGAWFYNGRWLNRDGATAADQIVDRVVRQRAKKTYPSPA